MPELSLPRHSERGIALVMALLVLFVISLLSLTLMLSLNVETKIGAHNVRESAALNTAEAGTGEALARLRSGEIPNNMNPRMVGQIFLTPPGTVPVLGADSVALATGQTMGAWLNYSTASRSSDVLTVQYKTDAARTVIYKYDPTKNPPVQTASGVPIFVVNVTGRSGEDLRRIVTEVMPKPYVTQAKGALVANRGIDFSGNSAVCGYNHRFDTPDGTSGRPGDGTGCQAWETGSGDLAGAWSSGGITNGGSSEQSGVPPTTENQVGFYRGPWEAVGMTEAEFFAWVGTPTNAVPNPANGIYYLDNDGIAQNKSGSYHLDSITGEGLLYVDGDVTINAGFSFRGLIYIEGDLKINGNAWILGGLIVEGRGPVKFANGGATVLYSSDAITQALTKNGGKYVTLSWRER
ncbi:MAG: hypothetical protein E6K78_05860 [Candidatus Eisenbacteria bacterium]|uniref:Type 4 fimbrial biogenesis protein PilX N-terminal domain-containing protein n=1 Tax=Eiseniibacteriota bacterium TaxID=2212470 RepID=A0A538TTJ7_UNCEI|nr:MAG: hypothetical protein E6K78_05860 [Candidatus Eisenbacteria bacterium]